MSFGIKAS